MKIVINFTTDNAAFEDYPQEREKLINKTVRQIHDGYRDGYIYDTNGNRVGAFKVTGK